jgi:DNA-binding IclR family transcriptional regulator
VNSRLPANVEQFLLDHVASVDQLEILFLLRADATRRWSAGEIGAQMRRPEASTSARLESMLEQGFVERDGDHYWYAPGSHDGDVESLERCFATRRAAVIAAIFADG